MELVESILLRELKFYQLGEWGEGLQSSGKQSTVHAYGCKDDLLQTCKRFDYCTRVLLYPTELRGVCTWLEWNSL